MKKIFLTLIILISASLSANSFDFVENSVYYNLQTQKWSLNRQTPKDVKLIYKMYSASGGYSEYYNNRGKLAIGPFSNREFIDDGNLIGIDNGNLKLIKYYYDNGYFRNSILDEGYIGKLFPEIEIIKLSQFVNNEITIYKKPLEQKKILILNDTKNNYYKYTFKPANIEDKDITGLITVSKFGKIVFSHYGDDNEFFPALKIHVKRSKNETK
jgi:hypothetical protein